MTLLEIARKAAVAIQGKATELGIAVTVCVIDANDQLTFLERMPGANALSLKVAPAKAHTSALLGMATTDLMPLIQPGQALFGLEAFGGGEFVTYGGGVPLMQDGKLIGGLGVSGGTLAQDTELAQIGLDALSR